MVTFDLPALVLSGLVTVLAASPAQQPLPGILEVHAKVLVPSAWWRDKGSPFRFGDPDKPAVLFRQGVRGIA